jgi:HSP20 family molecular chaperone IbpA
MTTMTRFVPLRTPFEDVAGLHKRLNSIFNDFARPERLSRIYARGCFVRSFTLPQMVNTEGVTAASDAGVLTISLAKKAEAQPKLIKVQVGAPKQVETPAARYFCWIDRK